MFVNRITVAAALVVVVVLHSSTGNASCPWLTWAWDTSYRSSVVVKVCLNEFDAAYAAYPDYSRDMVLSLVKESIRVFNSRLGSDFRMVFGDANGIEASGVGCQEHHSESIPSGQLWVTAKDVGWNCDGSAGHASDNGIMSSAYVIAYAYPNDDVYDLCMQSGCILGSSLLNLLQQTLVHEIGHTIFTGGDGAVCDVNSIVRWYVDSSNLWSHDIATATGTCAQCSQGGYLQSSGGLIKHRYSTDGISWTYEADNLSESTNLPVGVAYRSGANPYVISWVKNDGSNEIWTAVGNGVSWTSKQSLGVTTNNGLSLAYGNGLLVLAWADVDDEFSPSRRILWSVSSDGITWQFPSFLTSVPYIRQLGSNTWAQAEARSASSVTGPSIVFDSFSGHFILTYLDNSLLGGEPAVVTCVTSDPSVSFESCTWHRNGEFAPTYGYYSPTNTPGVACTGSGLCTMTHSQRGVFDSRLININGFVQAGIIPNRYQQINTVLQSSSYASCAELAVATSTSGRNVLAFQGNNNSLSGNIARRDSTATPYANKVTWGSAFIFGPTMVYGGGKFVVFYGN